MAFEIKSWYDKHEGGTKFYHVIRVISPHNNNSFSIEHYGPANVFVDHDKAATGQVIVRPAEGDVDAGVKKINEKRKRGYTDVPVTKNWDFDSVRNLKAWLKARLGTKSYQDAARIIDANFTDVASNPTFGSQTKSKPEPPKGMLQADYDYGTW